MEFVIAAAVLAIGLVTFSMLGVAAMALFLSTTTDSPNLKVGIAHAAAPARLASLRELVEHERPHAQIEITTMLGAVVGTHAGPGTVGFFWFEDEL